MDAPNLGIAAPLVFRQLGVHVVATGRGRPDLDDEGEGTVEDLKRVGPVAESLAVGRRNHHHVGDIDVQRRTSYPACVDSDPKNIPIQLLHKEVAQ